jgi:hypothetical protein
MIIKGLQWVIYRSGEDESLLAHPDFLFSSKYLSFKPITSVTLRLPKAVLMETLVWM